MMETIAVCAIVGGVALVAGRSLYKTLTGKNDHGGCCGKCGCGSGGCGGKVNITDNPHGNS